MAMKENKQETENARLREELKQVKKERKKLAEKLATANAQKSKLQEELKKKEDQKIELRKEQLQSLSNQLKDIDIQSLLSD